MSADEESKRSTQQKPLSCRTRLFTLLSLCLTNRIFLTISKSSFLPKLSQPQLSKRSGVRPAIK